MTPIEVSLLAAAALVTAASSAVVGLGGGVTLLAVMAALMPPALVVPIHGVVQLASNGTRAFLLIEHVHRRIFAYYMLPALAGVLLGARWYVEGAEQWFRPAVGVFILLYLASLVRRPRLAHMPIPAFALVGFVVGILASLVGATGPINAPFFLRDDLDKEQVIATQAAIQIATHGAKIPAFLALGFDYGAHAGALAVLVAAAVAGTYGGRLLLTGLSHTAFRRGFIGVLILISLRLILFD